VFESLDDLYTTTRWRGYYGGIRIIQALVVRFVDYCTANGIALPNRNFTLEYESTVPLRLGMGGSSAILTAALRAIARYYGVTIPPAVFPNIVLEAETKELGVAAGLQDRVIQAFEGVVYMDFAENLMKERGYGNYQHIDPALLGSVYVAYRTSLSEGTEIFHNNIRERWRMGDPVIVDAMKTWASYAEQGKSALERGDRAKLHELINANFDLRAKIYKLDEGNLEMIRNARAVGASANFAGSGGAIVGTFENDSMFNWLVEKMRPLGVRVIRPQIVE